MKKLMTAMCICASFFIAVPVFAGVSGYHEAEASYKKEEKPEKGFSVEDGEGNEVQVLAKEDKAYVTVKETTVRSMPGEKEKALGTVLLGTEISRRAVCDNGWSKAYCEDENGSRILGYIQDTALSEETSVVEVDEEVTAAKDCDILDFPGKKDGQVVGELLEMDEVRRTAKIDDIWSRIVYLDEKGNEKNGYIPTNVLEGQEDKGASDKIVNAVEDDKKQQEKKRQEGNAKEEQTEADEKEAVQVADASAGVISKSEGSGIFAEAVDGVASAGGVEGVIDGVQIGTPVAVSSDASLKPLGTFRITHYCPCSICCGPWANGITSTGVTATTNHTIAVDPSQIPYGSQVVINGQVYVAEDCGGAIKTNCIDIYVASHEEGESKGVYYTDVYLIQ